MSVELWLPRELEYFASMDWGHAEPGVILWWACLPEGRYHIVREWKFQWLADEEIAAGYRKRTIEMKLRRVRYVAGDPSMWIRDGRNKGRGQSRAETLTRGKMPMKKAENERVDGWSRVHSFLRVPTDDEGNRIGDPLLTIDESCKYLIRTLPAQQSDKTNAEDIDTNGDDHAVDALRYGAMSRPSPTRFMTRPTRKKETAGDLLRAVREGIGQQVLGAGNVRRVA